MSSSPPLVVADRYRLVAPLGQGGMGRVWRATDVVLHRDVAIKELVPPPGLTPAERQEMRERSLREARAIARLNNVNVVRVFDVLRTDADPWIVMEYVPSRSLQDTLAADGPFNAMRAAEIGLGVLGALRAAHRAGVVHRDVKPGNVLIGADGRVVLTDFGLATVPGDPNVTRTGLVLGSPAYIAPERARDGTAGPAADLWSLGATLYAAVEGASPFARPSAIATLAALATENPPPARNAGPLKPVLNGLLRKDPAHRISAEEAERLLLRATGRRSKLAFPMSPTMRRPGVGRERPALPGVTSPTGSSPVVPGPRPPVAPARPVSPPGATPASGGRAAAGQSRPPVYVPGKAPVGSDKPTRVDGPKVDSPRLDATRVDAPPVRDDQNPRFGTRRGSATPAPSQPAAPEKGRTDPAQSAGLTRTRRGEAGSFTAADVAAARRRQAAPEHEKSLADATALIRKPEPETAAPKPPSDATTVLQPKAKPAPADATSVLPPTKPKQPGQSKPSPADATSVLPPAKTKPSQSKAAPADATSVLPPAKAKPATPAKSTPPATKAPETPKPAHPDATSVLPPSKTPSKTKPAAEKPTEAKATRATAPEATAADASAPEATAADTSAPETKPTEDKPTESKATEAKAAEPEVSAPEVSAPEAKAAEDKPTEAEVSAAEGTEAKAAEDEATGAEATTDKPAEDDEKPAGEPADATSVPPSEPASATTIEPTPAEPEHVLVPSIPAKTRSVEHAATPDATAAEAKPVSAPAAEPAKAQTAIDEEDESPQLVFPLSRPAAALAAKSLRAKPDAHVSTQTKDEAPGLPSLPARPAWRPMEVRSSPGITIFGTRLTYRQAAFGAGVVLVVLVLLITLIAQAVGGDNDGNRAAVQKPGPTATAQNQNGTAGQPSQATEPSPPSAQPSTPPSTAPALPAGWSLRTIAPTGGAPGLVLPLPRNVNQSNAGNGELQFRWNNRLLIVGRTTDPKPDALKDWQEQEASRRGDYNNYQLIGIRPVNWRGFKSVADWEFLYTTSNGNDQHVIARNVLVNDKAAYSLKWYVSPGDWAASQADLQAIYQGFQPK